MTLPWLICYNRNMDYVWFILIILALCGAWYTVNRFDKKAKARNREEAYRVLDLENPTEKEMKDALKGVHLYTGRYRKDKEFVDLRNKLSDKMNKLGM